MVNIPNSDDHLLADNKTLRAELGVSLLQSYNCEDSSTGKDKNSGRKSRGYAKLVMQPQ
jgi:hypothetical protein